MHHISRAVANSQIDASDQLFLKLFAHGSLAIQINKPKALYHLNA